jgi:hypothetical protein
MSNDPPGGLPASTFELVHILLAALPVDELEEIARRHFSRSAIRRRLLDERNAAIRGFALAIHVAGESARALAERTDSKLRQFGASRWRWLRDRPPPEDLESALAHRIFKANGDTAPGRSVIRRALKGVTLAQKRRRFCASARATLPL